MAIPKHEIESAGPFAKWLMTKLNASNTTRVKLADELRMTRKTIFRHCKGVKPKFTDVIAYCWYFTKILGWEHDPEKVWQIAVREFNIDDSRYY